MLYHTRFYMSYHTIFYMFYSTCRILLDIPEIWHIQINIFFTNCPKCNILIDLLYLAGFSQISSQMLWVLEQGTVNKFNILILYRCVLGTFAMHVFFTIHVLPYMFYIALPYMFYCTRFQRLQTGIGTVRGSNYPLAVLCQDLGLFILLAAVLWIEEGGWWGGPFQAFWSSWVEHHARLVQGLWNWQVWAASPPATFVLHLEFRVQFWLLHSCVQFAVSADWEAQGKRAPSP